ncbi:MAG TPA: zinc-ribbon domain-containing protein [Candidatus Acidoferrales bacterium]|nr:zinc-ribbon domain-containing protein [Candidatus Acidoferrales bacterium]HXK07350.1 zinc-ribbon domain-containing protein [Verrucomicrobiae bacterium]
MPFCSQCGNQVGDNDVFCRRCGAKQPLEGPSAGSRPAGGAATAQDILTGIQPRTASILCYVPGIGWIASIIVLAADRFRQNRVVRFHGFQGLYLFVAWLLEDQVMRPLFSRIPGMHLHGLIQALLLGASIFMMVKASHDEAYSLPLFGDLAQKSMAED